MMVLAYRTVRRTTLIALGSASFLAGLWVAKEGLGVGWPWAVGAVGCLVFCGRKKLLVAVPAVIAGGLLFGLWRGSETATSLALYHQYVQQRVTITGVAAEDPTYNDKGQQDMRLHGVRIGGTNLPGQVRITTFSWLDIKRGDHVRVQGKLYEGFGNYQAAVYYADVVSLEHTNSWVEQLRRSFAASVYSVLPEPQASLGLGFLVGIRSQLPDELDDQLRIVGLTHVVVASGYNLTILIRLARRLFEKRSKYQTALVSVSLLLGFVAVTGFSPSMSRASLVAGLALAAWYYGRVIHPVTLLLVAAAITAAVNPLYLWGDLGWWLSFLAFAGVMLLAPLLQKRLFGERKVSLIGQVIIETISAQVTTLPLIVMIFGVVALLALPANVLVVPLVPLAMLCTFVAGVAGLWVPASAAFVALPAIWLLSFMTEAVKVLASFAWATVEVTIAWWLMVGMYLGLLAVGIVLWRRTGHSYLSKNVVE